MTEPTMTEPTSLSACADALVERDSEIKLLRELLAHASVQLEEYREEISKLRGSNYRARRHVMRYRFVRNLSKSGPILIRFGACGDAKKLDKWIDAELSDFSGCAGLARLASFSRLS